MPPLFGNLLDTPAGARAQWEGCERPVSDSLTPMISVMRLCFSVILSSSFLMAGAGGQRGAPL